jgi:N-acylneuraminate cytidylyltransferase
MKIPAFIFARGGSKGLPNKNIRLIAGKPLIAWAIEQALSVDEIDSVIVSTDSEEIAAISRDFGALVPFVRPKELSEDASPEWSAWQHALRHFQDLHGFLPTEFLSIPATAPLRFASDIQNCLIEFRRTPTDAVITVTESRRNPFFNMVRKDLKGSLTLLENSGSRIVRRQEAPTIFDITTVCYVLNPDFVLRQNSIFEGRVRGIEIPSERALDIDTFFDFQIAEFFLSAREGLK